MPIEEQIRAMVELDATVLLRDSLNVERSLQRLYMGKFRNVEEMVRDLYIQYADREGLLDYGTLVRTGAWDSIYRQIEEDMKDLAEQEVALTGGGMRGTLQKHYYTRIFMLSKLLVIPQPKWKQLTERYITTIMEYPWSGEMFSERIWANRDALVRNVKRDLIQGFVNGEHSDKMAVKLRDRFNTSFYNASRLARTEMARMSYEAHRKIYDENGVDEVMWIATLDEKTCPICGPRDGRRYELGKEPILPAHPHCRCDVAPAYSDEEYELRRHNQKDEEQGIKPIVEGKVVAYDGYEEWREANNIKFL